MFISYFHKNQRIPQKLSKTRFPFWFQRHPTWKSAKFVFKILVIFNFYNVSQRSLPCTIQAPEAGHRTVSRRKKVGKKAGKSRPEFGEFHPGQHPEFPKDVSSTWPRRAAPQRRRRFVNKNPCPKLTQANG